MMIIWEWWYSCMYVYVHCTYQTTQETTMEKLDRLSLIQLLRNLFFPDYLVRNFLLLPSILFYVPLQKTLPSNEPHCRGLFEVSTRPEKTPWGKVDILKIVKRCIYRCFWLWFNENPRSFDDFQVERVKNGKIYCYMYKSWFY